MVSARALLTLSIDVHYRARTFVFGHPIQRNCYILNIMKIVVYLTSDMLAYEIVPWRALKRLITR